MRIFISHGIDKSNPAELQFLDTLEQQLRLTETGRESHEVLLDRTRLEPGDDWAGILNDWLAECQVAILMLSKRALARPWVLKEATILSFRKARDPAFPFLPLLLPGIDRAAIDAHPGFSALRLDVWQAFEAGAAPDTVASFVKDKLAGIQVSPTTPLDRLQEVLENRICQANVGALERACEDLLGEAVAWSPEIDRSRQRARVFARAITRGRLGRMVTLTGMTKVLSAAALAKEHIHKVLDLAASYWVEEEVAARLRSVIVAGAKSPLAAAINSELIRSGAKMAVWRAQLPDIGEDIYFIAGGGSDNWGTELQERMFAAYYEGNKDEVFDIDEAETVLSARTEPIFFVIPPPVPDQGLLSTLHQRFPSVVFIVHTGSTLPSTLPDHVMPLTPGLQLDLEKQNRADYLAARKLIA